jgi:hypothetical protein
MRRTILLFATLLLTACGSAITSLSQLRGAPGETFTIHGRRLKDTLVDPVSPAVNRCDEHSLEVIDWQVDHITVRVPDVPAGVYQVYAYGQPQGAFERPRTNAIAFWVTAAHVDASVTDPWEVQVRSFATRYGKSAAWTAWMLADGRPRYQAVFDAAHALPCPLRIAVSYETALAYNPPWSSEDEHMTALGNMANPAYPGYHILFHKGDDPTAYTRAILGQVDGTSFAGADGVHLHYETIFDHEFGHILHLLHHYDTLETIGAGLHFPPGEAHCTMDRDTSEFCSACSTALNLPLDVHNAAAIDAAALAILVRYPPGW